MLKGMISALKEHSACSSLPIFYLNLWARFFGIAQIDICNTASVVSKREKTAIKLQSKEHNAHFFSETGD